MSGLPCCKNKEKKCGVCRNGVDIALLIIRVTLAIFFIKHGWEKVFVMGVENFSNMMLSGWPVPIFWGWLVALTELVGGVFVLLGVLTRITALGMAIISLVAWGMVKGWALKMAILMPNGMPMGGSELDLLSLGLSLALVFAGPGMFTLCKIKHPAMCTCPKCKAGVAATCGAGNCGDDVKESESSSCGPDCDNADHNHKG